MMETKDYKEGIREYDTYVFDLDGTLLSTLDDLAASCNYALRTNGMEEHSVDDIRRFVGNGVRKLMERAIPQGDSNPLFDKTYADFRKHYMEHNLDTTTPYPGIMDLLSRLKERNKKVAVVSNKFYAATQALCRHFFGDLVDVAIGERENIRKKPAPDTVEEALSACYGVSVTKNSSWIMAPQLSFTLPKKYFLSERKAFLEESPSLMLNAS